MFIMHDTEDAEYLYYNHKETEDSITRIRRAWIEAEMEVKHNEQI